MAVITISRPYGSGGDEIATRVCELLGYRLFDKRMMAWEASQMGLTKDEIVDFSEDNYKVQGFLERLLRGPRVVAQFSTGGGTRRVTHNPAIALPNFTL
jgi:hypothetical protein